MLHYVCYLKLKTLCFLIIIFVFCHLIFQEFIFLNIKDEDGHSLPILIWWTNFTRLQRDRLISCSERACKCLVTSNRTRSRELAAYLFYGSHIENDDFPLPRNYTIPWAIFHEESPKNYAPFLYLETQNIFNLTSTFSRYSDFPVTLQYLEDLALIKDTKNKYLDEIAPVLYIQSDCDTPVSRDYLVRELAKFVQIDSYGKCLTNKSFPKELDEVYSLDLYNEKLLRFISKYKFIIAFENSVCDDYITEKLWRPLIVGSVPIYLGSPTIEDWLPNNNSAILIKNYNSLEEVANLIKKINANDTLYERFLQHKLKSKVSNNLLQKNILKDHPILAFECFVCERTHQSYTYNKRNNDLNIYDCPKPKAPEKENTWYQHWDVGKCQAKALEILLAKDTPYTSSLFEETWKTYFYNKNC
ncbi:alpha-(1,3)-fucosyltransferase 10 isoform X2 [Anoplophora glabripennis]|uniref:alpha-(1,3)-fucosyltransferase 10 isoform X2 n=1 Tax=Anoplophora glabripennis TaxID=217634 RepID=UPI000873D3D3|nr:alpha-(1,3)-fucosyltransferase 10 isoform X2 [Anoplophora glabripennis]